ncbi:hypothetical protein O6H91_04G080400 [Diphasiastrum complanatum]|uniref:Uncharacterized protein n=1 Tax=Diphasiastrum complanatum TaxID=34168 RepID=A0ACC2DYN2_DIPCM|nr:hypothetical protein O6H91_04G080400 [Diphasiastrum complanatum]
MMSGFISCHTIASASKGRKMGPANYGMAAPAKPHITHDHIPVAKGKTTRKFLPLQVPLAFQSGHNLLAPASNAEKVARGCTEVTCYLDTLHDVSTGSEHKAQSVNLADMVHEFIEGAVVQGETKCGRARCNCQMGTCDGVVEHGEDDIEDSISTIGGELFQILHGLVACISEEEHMLLCDVKKAAQLVTEQADRICEVEGADCSKGCLKRALMKILHDAGYNAAICKSKPDRNIVFPGNYYYIDVVLDDSQGKEQRLIVDTEFQCQFEIARPTDQYASILQELPLIFVGKSERLWQMVNLVSEAVKASLRKRCMPLPPWRKAEYMRAKWFSPYKRTTYTASNHQRSTARLQSGLVGHTAIKGFDWDIQFTSKLELNLGGAADWKQNNRSIIRSHQLLGIVSNMFDEHGLGAESWAANKPRINPDQITVVTTDWQPPTVKRGYSDKQKEIGTLGLILKESGSAKPLPHPQQSLYPENKIVPFLFFPRSKQRQLHEHLCW